MIMTIVGRKNEKYQSNEFSIPEHLSPCVYHIEAYWDWGCCNMELVVGTISTVVANCIGVEYYLDCCPYCSDVF